MGYWDRQPFQASDGSTRSNRFGDGNQTSGDYQDYIPIYGNIASAMDSSDQRGLDQKLLDPAGAIWRQPPNIDVVSDIGIGENMTDFTQGIVGGYADAGQYYGGMAGQYGQMGARYGRQGAEFGETGGGALHGMGQDVTSMGGVARSTGARYGGQISQAGGQYSGEMRTLGGQIGNQGGQFLDRGTQFNPQLQDAALAQAQAYGGQLGGLEAQQGPSAAQAQLQAGLNQSQQSNLAMARSGSGFGESASAQSAALAQNAQMSQGATNQAAMLRASEDAAWRQRQAANLGAAAGIQAGAGAQFGQQAQFGSSLAQQQQQMNAAQYMQAMGMQSGLLGNAAQTHLGAMGQGAGFGMQGQQMGIQGAMGGANIYGQGTSQQMQGAGYGMQGAGYGIQGAQAGAQIEYGGLGGAQDAAAAQAEQDADTQRRAIEQQQARTEAQSANDSHAGGIMSMIGGALCLSPDTLISTPDGQVPVCELKEGDLVISFDNELNVQVVPIAALTTCEAKNHRVVRLTLWSGTVLEVSGPHPTADGRLFSELKPGDRIDGQWISKVEVIPYRHSRTYDILPDSETGFYLAGGVMIASTIPLLSKRKAS